MLEPFLADPAQAGILTDFDGTLSPIVVDAAVARPMAGAVDALRRLSLRYARVAVISGRPVSFLVEHAGGAGGGVVLSGLYGLEEARRDASGHWMVTEHADGSRWRPIIDEVVARAEKQAPAGMVVEHKGLAVTLHWRPRPELAPWAETFAAETARATGLTVHGAKASAELRPPVERDKGSVVAELAAGLDAVCFCGDDVGDLPAFAALREVGARHTLAVAARSHETAASVTAAADLVVDGPRGVLDLFHQLLR